MQRLRSYLFDYTFLEFLSPGESYSTNIKVRRNLDHTIWAGKISRPLPDRLENFRNLGRPYVRSVDFRDLDDRALLGFRLARIAGLRSLKAKLIPLRRITGFRLDELKHERINDNIFLTQFAGESLENYLIKHQFSSFQDSDIVNKEEVVKSFVFNLWVGNYDNKDKDYLVDLRKRLISIDYHLLGPGFQDDSRLALGAWGESFDFTSPQDTGWCIGRGMLRDFLKEHLFDGNALDYTIQRIKAISYWQLRWAMRGLNFYQQGTHHKINRELYQFLVDRRKSLRMVIQTWADNGFPIASLPKENGVK